MTSKPNEMGKSQHEEGEHDPRATQSGPDVVSLGNVDQALAAKMNLVNDVRCLVPEDCLLPFLTTAGN